MRTKVLILAPASDLHAQSVREQLDQLNIEHESWTLTDALSDRFQFSITNSGWQSRLQREADEYVFESFSAVWWRRPGILRTAAMPDAWIEPFIEQETTSAFEALLRSLNCFWVNNPQAQRESAYKLRQLNVAVECGLHIPDTLVTNDPDAAREFCAKKRQVIYKQIDERSARHFPRYQTPRGLPTQLVRESDVAHLDQVRTSAHLFQEKIEKQSDIRLTIVGQKLFAVEIKSQEGKGSLDFRLDYSVPMVEFDLPATVKTACLNLMRHFDLEFAAIDLCRTPADKLVFLEVNAAGQYLWMEKQLDMPISKELAHLLSGLAAPLNS